MVDYPRRVYWPKVFRFAGSSHLTSKKLNMNVWRLDAFCNAKYFSS